MNAIATPPGTFVMPTPPCFRWYRLQADNPCGICPHGTQCAIDTERRYQRSFHKARRAASLRLDLRY